MYILYFVLIIIASISWAYIFPEQAIAVLAELKRQIRLRIIQRAGRAAAKDLERNLHSFASKKGIETELVEEVLAENHDLIVDRLGIKTANDILGEPDVTERFY